MDVNCYSTAVGLARCACPCVEGQAPSGFDTSDSGLYIADLLEIEGLEGVDNCSEPSNPWTILSDSKNLGIRAFIADVNSLMASTNTMVRQPYSGGLGEIKGRNVVTPTGAYAGVRIRFARVKSGEFYLEKIGGVFDQAGTVNVKIYDQFNNSVGNAAGYDITTVAGQHAQANVGLILPMFTEWSDAAEYFFAYTVNGSNLPRENKITCGCGGFNPSFNTEQAYDKNAKGSRAWTAWAKVGGWTGDTVTDFDVLSEEVFASKFMYGLTLQGRMECDPNKAVCDGSLNMKDPLALSTAQAINYKSAYIAADKLLSSPVVQRANLINRETLIENRKEWQQAYIETVQYIAANTDPALAGCMECKSVFGINKQNILT